MRPLRPAIRPLTPDDGATVDAVFDGLSPHSRYLRFHSPMPRLSGPVRSALLELDGRDRAALVAEVPSRDGPVAVGIARLARDRRTGEAELAVAVVDAWQGRGVGMRLLVELGELASELGYERLHALVLPENDRVLRLLHRAFPGSMRRWDDGVVRVDCPLGVPEITDADLLAALVA